jgi:hypothetical protein
MAFMNNSQVPPFSSSGGAGYLIVRVSTALGAIPLEDALVTIRGAEQERSDVIYSLRTNSSGITEKVSLPAPNIKETEAPGYPRPYALYNVDVSKSGYLPLRLESVAIFDSVTSIQPAVMIPLTDSKYADSFTVKEDTSPSDAQRSKTGGGRP